MIITDRYCPLCGCKLREAKNDRDIYECRHGHALIWRVEHSQVSSVVTETFIHKDTSPTMPMRDTPTGKGR